MPPDDASEPPTAADIRRRFPDWEPFFTTSGRHAARRNVPGKAISVVGDSWLDVSDEITAAEGRLSIDAYRRGLTTNRIERVTFIVSS